MKRTIHTGILDDKLNVFTQDSHDRITIVMRIYRDGTFKFEDGFDNLTAHEINYINENKYRWYKEWQQFERQ